MTDTEVAVAAEPREIEVRGFNQTLTRLSRKVGDTEKNRRIETCAVVFLRLLHDLGGTFVWEDGPNRGHKFSDIWKALATKMPGFDSLGWEEQHEHVQEYAPRLKAGFYGAREWMTEWYGTTIYLVPHIKESGPLTVLTFMGDHKLEGAGITAAEMQTRRDRKMAQGQVRASAQRMVSANGGDRHKAMNVISEILVSVGFELENSKPSRIGEVGIA